MQTLLEKVMQRMEKSLDKTIFPVKPSVEEQQTEEQAANKCAC
jgi:hypothetical protein